MISPSYTKIPTLVEKFKNHNTTIVGTRSYKMVYLLFEKRIPSNTQEYVKVIMKGKTNTQICDNSVTKLEKLFHRINKNT